MIDNHEANIKSAFVFPRLVKRMTDNRKASDVDTM